jgi:hypothetical protein
MLRVEIQPDGGVHVSGRLIELLDLAAWTLLAARNGTCAPTFVADHGLTSLKITRLDD